MEELERAQATIRRLQVENELLEMKVAAQVEIIAAYRDALETFQNEKRLQTALHLHDLETVTKPKQ